MRRIVIAALLLAFFAPLPAVAGGVPDLKYNTAQWVPFKIVDATDESDETGVAAASLTFKYRKSDEGGFTTASIQDGDGTGSGQDCDPDKGAASPEAGDVCERGLGTYEVYLAATVFDTKGAFEWNVAGSGYRSFPGLVVVKTLTSDEESDYAVTTEGAVRAFAGGSYAITASSTTSITSAALAAAYDDIDNSPVGRMLAFPSTENTDQGTCSYKGFMAEITGVSGNVFSWATALGGAPETTCVVSIY